MSRIMLIDDEIQICELCAEFLRGEGFQVDFFADPTQALAFKGGVPDVLIVDMNMGVHSGIRVAEAFVQRSRAPTESTMAVILASGMHPRNPEVNGLASELLFTLDKPFVFGKLLALVREALAAAGGFRRSA